MLKKSDKKPDDAVPDHFLIPPAPSVDKDALKKSLLNIESNVSSAEAKLESAKAEVKTTTAHTEVSQGYTDEIAHRIIRTTCLIALVLWFFIILLLSITTQSSPFNTLMGLSPVLLTIIVTYVLVDKYHLETGFLMVFPFIFTGILLLLGFGHMLGGIDYLNLSVVNIIFGLLFEGAVTLHYSFIKKHFHQDSVEEDESKKAALAEADAAKRELGQVKKELASMKKLIIKLDSEEDIKKFISSIEDKAKALNAVIGRVYSVRRGGSENMRKKIKIDPEHYNEFNELKDHAPGKRKAAAISILKKIDATLALLERTEMDVFDIHDLTGLLRLNRDPNGNDRVIDVLVKNDSDPVKQYFDGAREFCAEALKELDTK